MKRFSNGDNGEGFHFNEDADDEDLYDEEGMSDMQMEYVGSIDDHLGTNLIETHFRQKILDKAAEIAKQDWFWSFRSISTRIKRIEKVFNRLIKMIDKD